MKEVSFREFLLVDEPCDVCGQEEDMTLGYTLESDDDNDYSEIAVAICRECLEEQVNKYDSLVNELEAEIAGPVDDLNEDITGC